MATLLSWRLEGVGLLSAELILSAPCCDGMANSSRRGPKESGETMTLRYAAATRWNAWAKRTAVFLALRARKSRRLQRLSVGAVN